MAEAVAELTRPGAAVRQILEFIRTTTVGGLLFLLPLAIVFFVLEKVVDLLAGVAQPVVAWLGLDTVVGIPGSIIATIIAILIAAFLVGLLARRRLGQALLHWLEQGVSNTLPQFGMYQSIARSLDNENPERIPVVLVPTDAGWNLGLLLEPPHGEWHAVFLPGSPSFSSGAVAYAHKDQVHHIDLTVSQLWMTMRRRGAQSALVYAKLAELKAEGKL